jgi:hypothetical protein
MLPKKDPHPLLRHGYIGALYFVLEPSDILTLAELLLSER